MAGSLSTIRPVIQISYDQPYQRFTEDAQGLVWQRNYYEHVIRNEQSLQRIGEYIAGNPARWNVDRENPAARTLEEKNAWLI